MISQAEEGYFGPQALGILRIPESLPISFGAYSRAPSLSSRYNMFEAIAR